MRSEIPQIHVVTAIADTDLEDYVSQLLYSQGWSIIFRAFDWMSLLEFLNDRSTELRTIVVFTSDTPGFTSDSIMKTASTTMSFVALDEVPKSAHEIMQRIRGQLRLPLVQTDIKAVAASRISPEIVESPRKLILVTGSAGAPGKTSVAGAIAEHLSQQRKVTLLDADFRSARFQEYVEANSYSVVTLDPSEKPKSVPIFDKKEIVIADVGVLPPLHEVVEDRRWLAILLNSLLEESTHLVYVAKTLKQSLLQLDQFQREISQLTKKVPVTYICISDGQTKETRKAEAAFTQLVSQERNFILPRAQLRSEGSGFLENFLTSNKKKEIGTIATSLM